jgi:glutaredoxin-like protein NrdH
MKHAKVSALRELRRSFPVRDTRGDQQAHIATTRTLTTRKVIIGDFMEFVHVKGTKKKGVVLLYALSTCGWCAKTKELLTSMGVDFSYLYVDLLPRPEMEKVFLEVKRFNPQCTFPTTVIDGKKAIVGFREEQLKEAFR